MAVLEKALISMVAWFAMEPVFLTRNNYLTEQLFKLVKTNLGN